MSKKTLPALALTVLGCACGGGPEGDARFGRVTLKGRPIAVTIVARERERRGAPAAFPAAEETRGFLLAWPRERFLKLEPGGAAYDAAFLDREGKVVDLGTLRPADPEGLVPRAEAAYALLVAPRTLEKLGVRPGDRAELSREVRAARPEELPRVRIGEATAWAELALTEAERQHGLMFRPRMSADDGMLFVYPEERPSLGFWMKNTLLPLDIAYFRADGTLVKVCEAVPADDPRRGPWPTYPSDGPAQYVLEMNRGWFRKKGLVDEEGRPRPGVRAEFPSEAVRRSSD
jgi:hypothetical protein